LIAAGVGRTWLELFFRPDQPKIPGLGLTYSGLISILMAIAGLVMLLVRYQKINLKLAENWEDAYHLGQTPTIVTMEEQPVDEKVKTPRARSAVNSGRESTLRKKAREKIAARKVTKETTSTRTPRAKKSP
jgi:hypothetical protein